MNDRALEVVRENTRAINDMLREKDNYIAELENNNAVLQSKWETRGLIAQKKHEENERYRKALERIAEETGTPYAREAKKALEGEE